MNFVTNISEGRAHQTLLALFLAELFRLLAAPFLSRAAFREYREHAYRTRETARLVTLRAETRENNIAEYTKWYGGITRDWPAQLGATWQDAVGRVEQGETRHEPHAQKRRVLPTFSPPHYFKDLAPP